MRRLRKLSGKGKCDESTDINRLGSVGGLTTNTNSVSNSGERGIVITAYTDANNQDCLQSRTGALVTIDIIPSRSKYRSSMDIHSGKTSTGSSFGALSSDVFKHFDKAGKSELYEFHKSH